MGNRSSCTGVVEGKVVEENYGNRKVEQGGNPEKASRKLLQCDLCSAPIPHITSKSNKRFKKRRRTRRHRRTQGAVPRIRHVITIDRDESAKDREAMLELAGDIVNKRILLYWESISAWVECEVTKYGGLTGENQHQHYVQYDDGMGEWVTLSRFRVVLLATKGRQFANGAWAMWNKRKGNESQSSSPYD